MKSNTITLARSAIIDLSQFPNGHGAIAAGLLLGSRVSKQEDNKLADSTQAALAEVDVEEVKAEPADLIRVMVLASVIASIMAFLPGWLLMGIDVRGLVKTVCC